MNLKSLNKTLCTMVVMALCAGAVNAQEAPKQDAPKPATIDVSGVLFFDYSYIQREPLSPSKRPIIGVPTSPP